MGSTSSRQTKTLPLQKTFDSFDAVLPPLHRKISKNKKTRSLYNVEEREKKLDIIKSRMKRTPRNDFTIPAANTEQTIIEKMKFINLKDVYNYSWKLAKLLKPQSSWGLYQHDPDTLPFPGFKPGLVMDLETCYTNDKGFQINKMKSYIQQIGACGIGNNIKDFDISCLLPEKSTKNNKIIAMPNSVDQFIETLNLLEQQPENSISGYKKVIGMPDISSEKFIKIYNKSFLFWQKNQIKNYDNPLITIKTWKNIFNNIHPNTPLLFKCEDALRLFAEYTKQWPVWYAHNGHGFDYIIMEKWFRIFDIPLYCKCEVYAPRKTTSMNYLRTRKKGPDYSVFNSKGEQIGRSVWSTVSKTPIICYDTMKMIKSDDRSKLRKGGRRISQGTLIEKIHLKTELNGKEKIVYKWNDGSQTSSLYSYKQQDLLNEVGITANDKSAHTALYDCLTCRELIYRAFSNISETKKSQLNKIGREKTEQNIVVNRIKKLSL